MDALNAAVAVPPGSVDEGATAINRLVADLQESTAQARRLFKREGENGGPGALQKANAVLAEFNTGVQVYISVLESDLGGSDAAFEQLNEAIEGLRAYLADLARRIDELLEPIRRARAEFQLELARIAAERFNA